MQEGQGAAGMTEGSMERKLEVAEEIGRAATISAAVYADPAYFTLARERIFARCWHLVADTNRLKAPGHVLPVTLLDGYLDEPLLITRDLSDRVHCLANVCTHRGNLLVEGEGTVQTLRCRYHGRRFALDGRFVSMPEFEGVSDFPSPADDLPRLPAASWEKLLFAAIDPAFAFDEWIGPVRERVGWLPLREFVFEPAQSRDYLVRANWALYCDNYLEGFHIPYVHAGLNAVLDYGAYRTELFPLCNLQVGIAAGGEERFDLPPSSPDFGQAIAAYYFWLFPNLMLNFYPWGLSVNIVQPLAVDRTRVSFLTYIWDHDRFARSPNTAAALDRVEREDEAIVERVQQGVRSRFYDRGRYSPAREAGVHHFHRLLARFLGDA
jgi:choline monooxygenase